MLNRISYVGRRLVRSLFVIVGIMLVAFFLVRLPAGDAVDFLVGDQAVSPEYVAEMRRQLGLDLPLFQQFFIYAKQLVQFDLGFSFRQQEPVIDLVLERMPATMLMAGVVMVFSLITGITLGILAARRVGQWPDSVVSALALLGYATPNFWLGLMLVLVFAVWFPILPPYGMRTIGAGYSGWAYVLDVSSHLVLPTLALGTHYMGVFARVTRASMIEVADMDFVKAARAKGITEGQVMWRHVLRNAQLSIVSYTGLQAGGLISGTVLIETVFAWPGIGRLAYDSIISRDYTVLLGTFFVTSILVILINLITDIAYTFVDPRIEF